MTTRAPTPALPCPSGTRSICITPETTGIRTGQDTRIHAWPGWEKTAGWRRRGWAGGQQGRQGEYPVSGRQERGTRKAGSAGLQRAGLAGAACRAQLSPCPVLQACWPAFRLVRLAGAVQRAGLPGDCGDLPGALRGIGLRRGRSTTILDLYREDRGKFALAHAGWAARLFDGI